jgi:hypothetical protein
MNAIFYISIILLSINVFLWAVININIISAHIGNHYYKRNATVYWFSLVFFLLSISITYFGMKIDLQRVSIVGHLCLYALTIISCLTTNVYLSQAYIFKQKMIPKDKIKDIVETKNLNLAIEIIDRIDEMDDEDDKLKEQAIKQVETALTDLKLRRRIKKELKESDDFTDS